MQDQTNLLRELHEHFRVLEQLALIESERYHGQSLSRHYFQGVECANKLARETIERKLRFA